jgi:hypothetical protein
MRQADVTLNDGIPVGKMPRITLDDIPQSLDGLVHGLPPD